MSEDTITFIKPIKIRYKRRRNDKTIVKSLKVYKDDFELIQKACKSLGITPNYFIKWCSIASAKAIFNNGKYESVDVLIKED